MNKSYPVVIIGAGPAGLTAGYELMKHGIKSLSLEREQRDFVKTSAIAKFTFKNKTKK